MSKISVNLPVLHRTLQNAAGNTVNPPSPEFANFETEFNRWLVAEFTPTGTAANIDLVNSTSSGVSGLVVDKYNSDAGTGGKFMLLTARRKAGTTAAILSNVIIVSINSVEIGRIYVQAGTNGQCGIFFFALPTDHEDARFALSGTSTTGDLIFALTQADPSLTIHLEIGFND